MRMLSLRGRPLSALCGMISARRTLGGEYYLGEEAKPGELELQGVPADAEPHGLSLAAASLGGLGLWRSSSGWWDETREE